MSIDSRTEYTSFKRRRRRQDLPAVCFFDSMNYAKRKPSLLHVLLVWIITQTVTIPVAASSNGLGYNSATGSDPLCWRSVQPIDIDMIWIPLPCQNVTLTLNPPEVNESYPILRTRKTYDYPVEIRIPRFDESITKIGVKLLFCVAGSVGFCSPFVLDEYKAYDNASSPFTHVESETIWIDLLNKSSLETNVSIPASLPYPNEYFPIAIVEYSNEIFRWDIANALPPVSRLLTLQNQAHIFDVSQGVRVFSFVAIAVSSAIITWLLWQTIKHRKQPVLSLSQADFLVVFLFAALVATVSTFLLQPHSDLYCQLSYPMILIPVQVMYSITLGRLWRIHAVVSPLLLEQYRKKLRHRMMWRMQVIQCLLLLARIPQQIFTCRFKSQRPPFLQPQRPPSQRIAVRRSVNSKQLSLVVLFFVFPQVVLQICSVILQPHTLELVWNSELSVATPQCANGQIWYKSLLNYAYAALMLLMLTLLVMAFSSRKLPSLFNETSVIYQTATNTLVLILLGLIVIGVTSSDGTNPATRAPNPDIQYLVWVTVLLSITLGSSIRLMIPKLKMVWRGETVVVSKLVSDHHHQQRKRYKESMMSASTTKLMHNVTGLDLEEDAQPRPASRRNSSYRSVDTNASSDYFDTLTPLTVDERGTKTVAEVPALTLPLPFEDDVGQSDSGTPNRRSFTEIEATFGNGVQFQDGVPGGRPSFSRQRTTRDVLNAAAADVDRRKMFLKKRSSRNGFALPKIVVSPEETPPRRLVLKMVDLQEELAAVNKNIMSGLAVKPEAWDSVVDLVTRIEKNFREDVVFSWRPPPADPIVPQPEPLNSPSLECLQEVEDEDSDHPGGDEKNPVVPKSPGSKSSSCQHSRSLSLTKLEREFKRIVDVREHKHKMVKYKNSFLGSEAVDAMLYNGLASSRAESVALARRLATERRVFQHVTNEHDFQDKPILYRFLGSDDESLSSLCEEDDDDDSSTGELSLSEEKATLKEQALRFLEIVNVGNRNYQGKQYNNVFVGSEAIDAMVYHGLAATRWEGVQLGRKLARDLTLFQHVHGEFELRDEFLFYTFRDDIQQSISCADTSPEGLINTSQVTLHKSPLAEKADAFRTYVDVRDRRFRMQKCKRTFVGQEAVDAMIYAGLAKTREEAVHLGRMLQRELRLFYCVSGDKLFEDGFVFYRFRDDAPAAFVGQDAFSVDRSGASIANNKRQRNVAEFGDMPLASLSEQVQFFKEIVPVSDRTHHFRKFSNVFVGCEAIDAMVFYGMAHTREQAVQLGRVLAREAGLFQHASNENRYAFCDEFLLYRYTGNNTTASIDGDIMEQQSMSTGSLKLERAGFLQHQNSKPRGALGLKAEVFRTCVDVRDRTYRMVKYKSCFIGSEAVDAMLFVGLAENREKAVELGRKLATQLRLFRPCSVGSRTSFDDAFVFYRFEERFEERSLHNSFNDFSHDPSIDNTIVSRTQLSQMAEKFRACAVVKDRKYRFRTYRQCFVGTETVNALVDSGVVTTHQAAVEYGRTLARELNLFRCVVGDYAFANDAILYAFVRDTNANASAEFSDQSFGSYNSRSNTGEFGDISVLNATEQGDGSGNLPILFEVEPSENGGDVDMIPLEIVHDSSHTAPV